VLIGKFPAETIRSPPARKDPAVPPIRHLAWSRLSATAVRNKGGVDRPPHTVLSTMAVRLLSALALQKISPLVEMAAAEMVRRVKAVLLAIAAPVMDGVARLTTIVWLQMDARVLLGAVLRLAVGMLGFAEKIIG
jgi:hypothetical protein